MTLARHVRALSDYSMVSTGEMALKIGINGTGLVQRASIEGIQQDAQQAALDGFSSYWLAEHPSGGFDALTVLSLVGATVPDIELGTAIVPTFPRHPMTLAGQTLTAHQACQGRLTLGIGLSHQVMMEAMGLAFEKPIGHLRDYLSVLMPLLETGQVSHQGNHYSCEGAFFQKPKQAPEVLVAALGPQALRVAGHRTGGTTLAWVGPKTIASHIKPKLTEAADRAGRPPPRILATLPICVTDQPDRIRALITQRLAFYAELPSYRAMFEREGVKHPGDIALVGSAAQVRDQLEALNAAGVTDYAASIFATQPEEQANTRGLLIDHILR
ncbi:MAG: TIGR03564 family F420-dependent LLM class oxidoreductase [Pseudomonadales bacterium]